MLLSSAFGRVLCAAVFSLCAVLLSSCGGGSAGYSGGAGTSGASFSISVSPSQISLSQASISSTPVNVTVVGNAGFSALVTISVQGLPQGVTINNASFPLNLGAGDTIQLMFTAAATAALGSGNIQFIGNVGGAQSTGNLSLQVTLAQVSSTPPLRTSFANIDAAPLSLGSTIAATKLLVYDSFRQQIFASNTSLNEVDVFSTVTRQQLAAIPVPYPYGIDISADGTAVYVGTFSDFLYVIDPQKLEVINRISFAVSPSNGSAVNSPQAVATLSDGTLALLMDFGDQFGLGNGTSLIIWNPHTNSTTTVIASPGGGIGPLARSGDHSKIAFTFQGSIVPVNLYDVASAKMSTGTYTGGGGIPYALALNADGSELAVGGGLTLQTFDGQMNPQQSVNIESCTGLLFSPDGSKIYHSVSGVRESVFDAKSLELVGVVLDVGLEGSVPGDIDATGMIYGLSDHGVSFIDASFPVLTPDVIGGMDFATPQAGLLNAATPTSFGVGGTVAVPSILFGASPAPKVSAVPFQQGEKISATAPSSSTPGPVNVFVQWPDGLARLQAEDFSYGPWARYIFESGGPPQGGAPIGLAGYGYGWSLGSPQIFFGPNAATINLMTPVSNYIEPYPYQQLEVTLMTSPAGSPGPADVKIVSPTGAVTVPGGFHFMNQVTAVPLTPNNLLQGVWDESRNQIYFTAGSQIQVYSTISHQFTTPIAIPNSTAATQLTGIAMTPDNSKLVVSDFGDSAVLIIDLSNVSSVASVSTVLPSDAQFNATSNPVTLAVANNGKILVAVPNRNISSPGPNTIREIDLSTLTVTARSELQADASAVIQPALGGSELLFFDEGEISLYSAATDSFSGQKSLNLGGSRDSAISADGNRIAVEDALADGLMESLGFVGYIDLFVLDANSQFGEKWHSTGSLLYIPIDHGFDLVDGNTGRLRERISLPDVVSSQTPPQPAESVDTLLVDSTGQNIVMITAAGVTYVQLDRVPLGIGSATPSFGAPGTVFTLRGSGFTSGTTASLNGTIASVTFVDADTLRVTAPQNAAGAARIIVTNPDGETYSLDAGFNYGSSPALQRVRLATGRAATPSGLGPLSKRPAAQRAFGRPAFYREKL